MKARNDIAHPGDRSTRSRHNAEWYFIARSLRWILRYYLLREVGLDVSLTTAFEGKRRRIAYERLLLDLIDGDPTLFVRRDEVEAQWQWIDSIIAGWQEAGVTATSYAAGNWGPSSAIALIERDGASWYE